MGQFFAYRLFQIFKKSILANLKMSKTIFCSSPLNIFKRVTYKSQNTEDNFLRIPFLNI